LKNRKVERPSYDVLLDDINKMSLSAVGRKYGVTHNAIKKWIKNYEK
jgi:transposase-like protein